ncbi:MAG TPA: dienelactone hydrolase family protein [Candidatus Saccharimonadales bacterium]|nr:dienelactone hydrolase family protein [Candidatus Saccharimonadales bacterium]
MKQYVVFSLLTLLTTAAIFTPPTQNAYSQETTGLSVMTLVSFGNDNSTLTANLQPIENKTVTYFEGNTTGYLVYPNQNQSGEKTKLPAVVMIHENKGLNDYIKESANLLAKNGYVVLAVDLFNGEVVTNNQERSRELTGAIRENPDIGINNMKAAVNYLQSLDNVNPSKIASLGWCFGGQQSLQLAINSKDYPLAATVIYYGRLSNDTQALSNITWPVLGIFGGKDQSISVDSVTEFEKALNDTGITNEIYIYPNVGHAFANPSNDNYAPTETADAWKKTLDFLNRYLKSDN